MKSVKHPTLAGGLLLFLIVNCVVASYTWRSDDATRKRVDRSIVEVQKTRAVGEGNRALLCDFLALMPATDRSDVFEEYCVSGTVRR